MQDASKKLTESLHEVYEPDWYGREDVKMIGEVRWVDTGKKYSGCKWIIWAIEKCTSKISLNCTLNPVLSIEIICFVKCTSCWPNTAFAVSILWACCCKLPLRSASLLAESVLIAADCQVCTRYLTCSFTVGILSSTECWKLSICLSLCAV